MAEEEVIAFPQKPSDLKRKLENVESELLEQHTGSIGEDSVDDVEEASDCSQTKRPKLDGEATNGLGIEKNLESGEERSKEEGTGELNVQKDENQDPLTDEVHVEKSKDMMDDVDDNGKTEDNQPGVSVEESKEVNISDSQKEAEESSKETSDVIAEKDVENENKEVNDENGCKEVIVGGSQKENGDESKEVNGRGSHEETGDESKEENGGSSCKEVDVTQSITRKIDVPSSKVGTLIGKGGEMVRLLQQDSGAKIQIRRDAEADPNSPLRPVEIIGNLAAIEKAEKLINQVITETEAGRVPSISVRGVPEQMEIKVPNDKVGVIIGRGGETIKHMQTKSRARIQLIPHEEGDGSKERTVRISGDKRQIDIATALIKDVMYQDTRPSHYSGGYNQPAYQPRGPGGYNQPPYQPRGPGGPPQWGSHGPHGPHSMPYNYHHGGPYPSQGLHYRPPNSGGYPPQHMPPRSGYGSGWEQRPPHSGLYDSYGRQGSQNPSTVPSHAAPYSQAGPQQNYGQMYDQPNYDNPPMHQSYGAYGGSQQGYPPTGGQHQTSKPYGMQGSAEPGYGPPRPAAPSGDVPYQGPTQAAPSYGTNMAPQQQYGYASSAPGQQTYPSYSSAAPADGYNNTQAPAVAPAYEQHGVQPASGVQQTSLVYGNTPAQSNGNYGYGSQYPSYGGGVAPTYAAPGGQTTYSQTAPAQAGYEQSATHSAGYAAAPGTGQ